MALGRFVTIEGTEGVGKSTNLRAIETFLGKRGIRTLITREPGGTPVAEAIRELLVAHRDEQLLPMTELLLIFAARHQHVELLIKPALRQGTWVICDRFTDSTYAYQGSGRGLGTTEIRALEDRVLGNLRPDLTFLLDLPPSIGLARARARSSADRFEGESEDFFARVRSGFLGRARSDPDRCRILDTSRNPEEVASMIENELDKLIVKH